MKKIFLYSIIMFILLFAGVLAFIAGTPAGTRLLMKAASGYFPDALHYGDVSGTLLGTLVISRLSFENERMSLDIDQLEIRLRLLHCLKKELYIDTLLIKKIACRIIPKTSSSATEASPTPFGIPPFSITVKKALLEEGSCITKEQRAAFREASASLHIKDTAGAVELSWKSIALIKKNTTIIESSNGSLLLSGSTDRYALTTATSLSGAYIPSGEWTLKTEGNSSALDAVTVHGKTLEGNVDAYGSVVIRPFLEWQGTITAQHLNPGEHLPEWQGDISFSAAASGSLKDEALVSVDIKNLNGSLRQRNIKASGTLAAYDRRTVEGSLTAAIGPLACTVFGKVGRLWDIAFSMTTPDIHDVFPGAHGSITANGTVSGIIRKPLISINGTSSQWSAQLLSADRTVIDARIDLGGSTPSFIKASAEQLTADHVRIDTMTITARGSFDSHTINATASLKKEVITTDITAGMQNKTWAGRVTGISLNSSDSSFWSQSEPAVFSIQPGRREITGHIRQAPLGILNSFFSPRLAMTGFCNAQFFFLKEPGNTTGESRVTISSGSIASAQTSSAAARLSFERISASASVHNTIASLTSHLSLKENNYVIIKGTITSPNNWEDPNASRVTALLKAEIDTLDGLAVLIPYISEPQGNVSAHITAEGILAQPSVSGTIILSSGSVRIPAWGTRFEKITVRARSDRQKIIVLNGSLYSGTGNLVIHGSIDPHYHDLFPSRFSITGDRFSLYNTPAVQMSVKPSLKIETNRRSMIVSGSLDIQQGKIMLKQKKYASITLSDDVIIVTSSKSEPKNLTDTSFTTTIGIVLSGEDISFKGYGLEAGLKGRILYRKSPGKDPYLQGMMSVTKGTYQAYGQNLNISKGKLLFEGPMDNPSLDIEAVRTIDTIMVGIRITGTLLSPLISVFSEPAMPQADALSYLLLGQPLSQATAEEGSYLISAVAALRIAGEDLITKSIGEFLDTQGVDLTAVDTDSGGYLMLGKSLTSKLYFRYGFMPFSTGNAFLIRYYLNNKLTLQAESSSLTSGMDLLYTIEYEKTKEGFIKDIHILK